MLSFDRLNIYDIECDTCTGNLGAAMNGDT
jgi:hypothetical protein